MKKLYPYIILFCLSALTICSCKKLSSFDYSSEKVSAYSIMADDPYNYSLFKYIIDRAGLTNEVKDGGYTIFAPTNAAFFAAGYSTVNLQKIPLDTLAMLVKSHLIKDAIDLSAISGFKQITQQNGGSILLQKIGNRVYADGADVTSQSTNVSKGALNTINKVFISGKSIYDRLNKYYTSSNNNAFTMLVAAIDKASLGAVNYKQILSDPDANYTLFAPTNSAFIKAGYATVAAVTASNATTLSGIIASHLVLGKKFTTQLDTMQVVNAISGSSIYSDRINSKNRYTYFYENGLAAAGGSANMEAGAGIIDAIPGIMPISINTSTAATIQADTSLTFFNKALQIGSNAGKYDFVKMVSDNTNTYTVFAINNKGFRANGFPTLQSVSDASPAAISDMLLLHFANKRLNGFNYTDNYGMPTLYMQKNLVGPPTITSITVSNTPTYNVQGPGNQSQFTVMSPNVVTTNGLINIIQGILKP